MLICEKLSFFSHQVGKVGQYIWPSGSWVTCSSPWLTDPYFPDLLKTTLECFIELTLLMPCPLRLSPFFLFSQKHMNSECFFPLVQVPLFTSAPERRPSLPSLFPSPATLSFISSSTCWQQFFYCKYLFAWSLFYFLWHHWKQHS